MPEHEAGPAPFAATGPNNQKCRLGWGWVLFLLALQIWSRYLPAPQAVLVADDWSNWARCSFYVSPLEALRAGLQEPHRPISQCAVETGFWLFGDQPLFWTLVSLVANSLLLLAMAKMVLELTGRRWTAVAAGIAFVLLPNLTETYHFSTQVLNEVTCALVPYAVGGWMWVAYLRRGGGWRLAVAALAYAVGLFSYEAGILLPAAYLMLIPWRRERAGAGWRLAPFALVGVCYLAWRATNAFGLNEAWFYPGHMQTGLSWRVIAANVGHLGQCWVGNYMLGALLSGWESFSTLTPGLRLALFVGDVGVVALIGWGLFRLAGAEPQDPAQTPFSRAQMVCFALAWAAAAWAISAVSYIGGRLNVIPAIGISLLAALVLERRAIRVWGLFLLVPALLALVANQGTAESYRQAGAFNRGMYAALRQSAPAWRDKKILLFDSRALRQRQTPGLLKPLGEEHPTWAKYGSAPLMRGFTLIGMVRLASGQKELGIHVMHDVEYGARIEGDRLIWHERFDPSRPRTNSIGDAYVVDCLLAGQGTE